MNAWCVHPSNQFALLYDPTTLSNFKILKEAFNVEKIYYKDSDNRYIIIMSIEDLHEMATKPQIFYIGTQSKGIPINQNNMYESLNGKCSVCNSILKDDFSKLKCGHNAHTSCQFIGICRICTIVCEICKKHVNLKENKKHQEEHQKEQQREYEKEQARIQEEITRKEEDNTCPIDCLPIVGDPYFLPCSHRFHKKCIEDWLRIKKECPICRLDPEELLKNPHKHM